MRMLVWMLSISTADGDREDQQRGTRAPSPEIL
jgi:hypothetical protein